MAALLFWLTALAALSSAIVGGIFYGFSSFVMRGLARIEPAQGVAAMNAINVVVITPSFMLPFLGTAPLGLALAAATWMNWPMARAGLVVAAAAVYLLGCLLPTMAINQPMNLRLAALPPAEGVATWPGYVARWTAWNHVRTAAALLAAGLFTAALF